GARAAARGAGERPAGRPVPVWGIMRSRGVASGIFISLAVLSTTDVLTAYLPVLGEHRGIAPATVGLLLSLRAAATIACRLVMTPMIRLVGRTALMAGSCLLAAVLCASVALPLPVWGLATALALLGFALGVGQPLSMTTVVQAAPDGARSTALALRLTGNRFGQAAAPAAAGALAGLAGTAAPFVLLGLLLLGSAAVAGRGLRHGGDGASRTAARGAPRDAPSDHPPTPDHAPGPEPRGGEATTRPRP
ncbi:MFS transporter, partial [Streptomyces buecherae]|uniref:MFS transporter n=1 Tax=Streptomyces buecherae TaxID=2763006 RepID=UPI00365E6DC7